MTTSNRARNAAARPMDDDVEDDMKDFKWSSLLLLWSMTMAAAGGGTPCRAANRSRSDCAEEEEAENEGIADDIWPIRREGRGPGTGIFDSGVMEEVVRVVWILLLVAVVETGTFNAGILDGDEATAILLLLMLYDDNLDGIGLFDIVVDCSASCSSTFDDCSIGTSCTVSTTFS